MEIKSSELIINPDGSVYHLNIKPQDLATNIILVGDQNRVEKVSKYFDTIEFETQKREFKTHTGTYKGKRFTVISTGIGPDNIDIVLNELDALVNIDFETREIKKELTSLNFVRFGTSGSLQTSIPVDSIVASEYTIGLDNMMRSYIIDNASETAIEDAFVAHTNWDLRKGRPYVFKGSETLVAKFRDVEGVIPGFTATAGGFYGPQGRVLRLPIQDAELNHKMDNFTYNGITISNLEMETAAIYGLSKLLGHNALSLNAIIANRANGTFSQDPYKTVEKLIELGLNKLAE